MVQAAKLEGIKGFQEEKTKGVRPWMLSEEGHFEYEVYGGHTVSLTWSSGKTNSRNGKE